MIVRPARLPADSDAFEQQWWEPVDGGSVAEITSTPPFEGEVLYHIGVDTEREYRETQLENPSRIVVDILE